MKKVILLVFTCLLLVSCSTKKFDEGMNNVLSDMGKTVVLSSMVCDKISDTWQTAIYDHKGPGGDYCSDFNIAILELLDILEQSGTIDSIKAAQSRMESTTSKLNNPPTNRKECYNDLVEIVSEVSQYAEMATDPSGSLTSYNVQVNAAEENISKKIKKFDIKYSEYINIKPLNEE